MVQSRWTAERARDAIAQSNKRLPPLSCRAGLTPDATLFLEDSAEQDEGWQLSIATLMGKGCFDLG